MKKSLFLAVIVLLLAACPPAYALSQMPGQERVRVGCVDIDNFLVLDHEGRAQGYGAEYLAEIAKHTGWSYEFVQASWSDCLEMLEDGRIDLLLPAEYSEERAEKFLYSETECCMDYAALVGLNSDTGLYFEDYQRFNGIAVGLIEGNYLNEMFERYADRHGFHVQKRYYATMAELNDALSIGEIRAAVNGNMTLRDDQRLLAKINFMPAYFITAQRHPELMEKLNNALHDIKLNNPYYTAGLHSRYYGQIERQSVGFTRQEMEFIQACPPLKVLVDRDDAPLMWYDEEDGEYRGIYTDIARLIESESGLKFQFVSADEDALWAAAENQQGDLILNAYDSPMAEREYHIQCTDSYYAMNNSLLGKRGSVLDLEAPLRIAVSAKKVDIQAVVRDSHPDWEMIVCKDTEACLEQVLDGDADAAMVNSIVLQAHDYLEPHGEWIILYADPVAHPICMGVAPGTEQILVRILNKAIYKLDDRNILQCTLDNTLGYHQRLTLNSLIHNYTAPFFAAILGAAILVLAAAFLLYRNRMQQEQNQLLAQKNRELEEMNHQLEESSLIQRRLKEEMEQDPLTGLKNKKAMEYHCREALAQMHKSAALLMIDLDNFKQINDKQGHFNGDQVLQSFGEVLQRITGEGQLAGRIGGDEFAVLLPDLENRGQAEQFAQTLLQAVGRLRIGEEGFPITCSVGIALGEPGTHYPALFKKADAALYVAKRNGKNSYSLSQ